MSHQCGCQQEQSDPSRHSRAGLKSAQCSHVFLTHAAPSLWNSQRPQLTLILTSKHSGNCVSGLERNAQACGGAGSMETQTENSSFSTTTQAPTPPISPLATSSTRTSLLTLHTVPTSPLVIFFFSPTSKNASGASSIATCHK